MASARLNRREFLRGRTPRQRPLELSCERLYMKYVDARNDGEVPQFLRRLERELRNAGEVRLTGLEWLACDDFGAALEPLLRWCRSNIRGSAERAPRPPR